MKITDKILAPFVIAAGVALLIAALWQFLATVALGWGAFRVMAHRAGWRRERRRPGILRELVILELGALLGLGAGVAWRRRRQTL